MKKVKSFAAMLLAVLLVGACLMVTSCAKSEEVRFPNTPSGFEFGLSEAVLSIEQEFTPGKAKKGYVENATAKVEIVGLDELSYFDGKVTFTWSYQFLNDAGVYENASYSAIVELDLAGDGKISEKIPLTGHRNVTNITLDMKFEGFAIKK